MIEAHRTELEHAPIVALIGESDDASADFLLDIPGSGAEAVLPTQSEAHARTLLDQGVPRVYLGEAPLRDSRVVTDLVADYGPTRIGLYVPARRMPVSWNLERVSNADFTYITPSLCAPGWEVLRADGTGSGLFVEWWIQCLFELGASQALVRVDIADDSDLNLCATLHECFGERIWIGPLHAQNCDFADWVGWGNARRLAVPRCVFENNLSLSAWRPLR